MNTPSLTSPAADDSTLVAQSLAGDRSAFGRIVARYQSLICSLAFSATGSLHRSEDLAQDTFLAAWKSLRELRDPAKLRSWLCGIARHSILGEFRRLGREPAHAAAPLEGALELPAPDAQPAAQAITNEEAALLWREVGQLPVVYREPLVLFYRENKSVATVAQALDLTEDAALQRLSRGRKLLHERMLSFVEDTLTRTTPGHNFTLSVESALPILATAAQVSTAATAVKSGVAAKSGGLFGLFTWLFAPLFLGIAGAFVTAWTSITATAPATRARRFMIRWMATLWISVIGINVSLGVLGSLTAANHWSLATFTHAAFALWWIYTMVLATLFVQIHRRMDAFRLEHHAAGLPQPPVRSVKTIALEVSGIYLANFCWFVWLSWMMGDRALAWLLTAAATALGLWHFHRLRMQRHNPTAYQGALPLSIAIGLMLLVVNLRVDAWAANILHTTSAQMSALLPMSWVHLATLALLLYTAVLIYRSRPTAAVASE